MGVIYGVKQAYIGTDEVLIKCPCCEVDNFADLMVSSNYYHLYFIPMFPFEKEANIICKKCGLKRYNVPFGPLSFRNYTEIKNKYRHPIYTYLFVAIMSVIAVAAVVSEIIAK